MKTTTFARTLKNVLYSLIAAIFLTTSGAALAAGQPVITNYAVLPDGTLQMQLLVEVGESYTFEISNDLIHWEAVAGVQTVPTNILTVVDDTPVTSSPSRFYRLRVGRFIRFDFGFSHYAQAGQFGSLSTTPTVSYPVTYNGYRALFGAQGDAPYPNPADVFFTGPAGSGIFSLAASADESEEDEFGADYFTGNLNTTLGAPEGTWTVNYRGTNITHTLGFPPLSRLIIPVPSVVVDAGILKSVSWVYRDRTTGQAIANRPAYMEAIQVQIEGTNERLYDSPENRDPAVTTHVLSSSILWSNVRGINMAYDDTEENHYVVFFPRL
jgi:hypothetical protein